MTANTNEYTLKSADAQDAIHCDILLQRGNISHIDTILQRYHSRQLLVVTDKCVAELYAQSFYQQLHTQQYRVHLLTIPTGEKAKNLATLSELYEQCFQLQAERQDVVLALGGGVVGDVAGMLAGTYLRGLEFIQIPTSLIGMVTASIGGKVGVNYGEHKNLIGLFKHPSLVVIDPDVLQTLPKNEFLSGLGELITVGVLGASQIFFSLEAHGLSNLDALIADAIECKCRIVEADPFEQLGIRSKLNLGHTFGHALEKLSNFTLSHGLAVSVGLYIASRIAATIGLCSPDVPRRIYTTSQVLGLPSVLTGYNADELINAMRHDKKRTQRLIQFILPTAIGHVKMVSEDTIPYELLHSILHETINSGVALHG